MTTELSESSYETLIGTKVGDYVIDGFIGAGGQAAVFRAHNIHLPKTTERALKIFGLAGSDISGVQAGLNEAKKAAAVRHPSVMTFFDPGIADLELLGVTRQILYIPMDLSRGSCEDSPPFSGRDLSIADFETMKDLLDGLNEIHEHEILHEDIKPANILQFDVRIRGQLRTELRITDFGIAQVLSAIGQHTGELSGLTPAYAAPERFFHEHSREADIYSMGATLFYMITGKPPIIPTDGIFANVVDWRNAHQKSPRPNAAKEVPSCPHRLALLLTRMMSIDPKERPDLNDCQKQVQKIIDSIEWRKNGFPVPSRLAKELNRPQFPARYVAEFQGIFKPAVHKICNTELFIVRIKMGHIVFSEYRRLILFLVKRFSDSFSLYETWGSYDLNMHIWCRPGEVEHLEADLETEFVGSEVKCYRAKRIRHFHTDDERIPEDADSIYVLALQDSIFLPNVDRTAYLSDEFNRLREDHLRAFTYVESYEYPLKPGMRAAILSRVREKLADMIRANSPTAPRFPRISIVEFMPDYGPLILLVEFVVSEYKDLHEIPTAISGLDIRLKTSTSIATSRIVIQSSKIFFD